MTLAMLFPLDGKRALVKAAIRGLGARMAMVLADADADDITLEARTAANVEWVRADIASRGGTAATATLNVAQTSEIKAVLAVQHEHSALVKSAGTDRPRRSLTPSIPISKPCSI